MTLFIELPIHCRGGDYGGDGPKDSIFDADHINESERTNISCCDNEGANVLTSRLAEEDPLARSDDGKDEFLSDPDLVSESFPQSSSLPRLTILASPRPVSKRRKDTILSNGSRVVYVTSTLDARVAGALLASCHWDGFRYSFVRSLVDFDDCAEEWGSRLPTNVLVLVSLRWPSVLSLDAAFGLRVLRLLHARLDLEVAMAWLSTLGGGFSALGDYYGFAAEKAQKISLAQMKLARDMGDPIMAAKSWVWFSLALIQKGQIQTAYMIVKTQLAFSRTKTGKFDPRLKRMCKGVLSKIRYSLKGGET